MRLPLISLATLILAASCTSKTGEPKTDNGSQQPLQPTLTENATVCNYDTTRFYVVIKDTYSYVKSEDETESLVANEELQEGNIITGGGAAWIEDYNDELYCYSWRADEWYFYKKDVKVKEYLTLGTLPTEQLNTPLTFTASNDASVTLFKLDLNGHKLEIPEDFNLKDTKGCLYMMQFGDNMPEFMEVRNDSVCLSHPYLAITREPAVFDGCEDMIEEYKLTQDGMISAFYDPDFMTNADYCPAEDALLVYGMLYYR